MIAKLRGMFHNSGGADSSLGLIDSINPLWLNMTIVSQLPIGAQPRYRLWVGFLSEDGGYVVVESVGRRSPVVADRPLKCAVAGHLV
jgi:hypothetical protein